MEKRLGQILSELNIPQLSLKEVLENYKDIELTEEEITVAILGALNKKVLLKEEEKKQKIEQYKRELSTKRWNFDISKTFFFNRAKKIFDYDFILDDDNSDVFELLCHYFNEDEESFLKLAKRMGIENASLTKGLFLAGNYGLGKTDLMKLFSQNKKVCFTVVRAKTIANEYAKSKDKDIPIEYVVPTKNAVGDPGKFYQPLSGLCIDEIGSELPKNNFGNVANVIGDLIETRYAEKFVGPFLHGTSNLSADELKERYGERVTSRMRQIFNWIVIEGQDRRK